MSATAATAIERCIWSLLAGSGGKAADATALFGPLGPYLTVFSPARAYAVAAVADLSSIVFLLFFLTFLVPMFTQRLLATKRYRAIRKLEQRRGSRVITLIHRQ